jgi:3-deoxy-7-phosphoheptulonate synthase
MRTDDLRINRVRPLIAPAILAEDIPLTGAASSVVATGRRVLEAILDGRDNRLALIVGPCSIHDPDAALEYAQRLKVLADAVADQLFVVMRVYFEKPRTTVGWKGLINDPDLDGSYHINKGLRLARQLLADVAAIGLPAGTEFLDTTLGQFYADLISWGAIGARTAESQIHRELASGLSMPVGVKNRTDGNVQVAVDALLAASSSHLFPSLTKEGAPAILETTGNPYCHVVLRGGSESGPNYGAAAVAATRALLANAGLPQRVMIDASHGNSEKDPLKQAAVVDAVLRQKLAGDRTIRALMLESHLLGGRQDLAARPLKRGMSITDACLSFERTDALIRDLANRLARR